MTADGARRIVLAPSAYAPSLGGVEELTAKLARAFVDDGRDVVVSTMRWPKSLPDQQTIDGIAVRREVFRTADTAGWRSWVARADQPLTMNRLVRQYRAFRPDVLHIQCVSHAAAHQARAARRLGIPLVVTLQGELTMDATDVFGRSPRLRASLRDLMANADAVTACSAATLREAEQWFGRPLGERGRVVYNGVDIDEFAKAQPMQHSRPYVFGIGRHVHQKGFDVLIDAFAGLIEQGRENLDLVIAGDGADHAALRTQVARLGLDDRVQLIGRTDRAATASWFKGASLFVLSSRHEPFGIVNVEAMAAGTPVVATAVGGVPEFVHDGKTGLLIPPDDAVAMADAIARVVDDDHLRTELVNNASRVIDKFRWSSLANEYLDVYRSAQTHLTRHTPEHGDQR